jgi:phage gpG-like protein
VAAVRRQVLGLKDLDDNLKAIVRLVPKGDVADAILEGAKEYKAQIQQNILWQLVYRSGALYDSVRLIKRNQYRVDIQVGNKDVPYAAVHEYGGTFTITDRQRRFFWAKWRETGDEMWKALALSITYTIPARPYVRTAIDSGSLRQRAMRRTAKALEKKIQEVVK